MCQTLNRMTWRTVAKGRDCSAPRTASSRPRHLRFVDDPLFQEGNEIVARFGYPGPDAGEGAVLTERAEMLLTPLPPPIAVIGKREIGVSRASASHEPPGFDKPLIQKELFSGT